MGDEIKYSQMDVINWKSLVKTKVLSSNILDVSVIILSILFIVLNVTAVMILGRCNGLIFYSIMSFSASIMSVLISFRLSIAWHESELCDLCNKQEKEQSPYFDRFMDFFNHFSLGAFAWGLLTFCLGIEVLFLNDVRHIGVVAIFLGDGWSHG